MAFHSHACVHKHTNFSQGSVETDYRRNKKHEYYCRKLIQYTVSFFQKWPSFIEDMTKTYWFFSGTRCITWFSYLITIY